MPHGGLWHSGQQPARQERRLVEKEKGRIAEGWPIVEDLAMIPALVLLPAVAGLL